MTRGNRQGNNAFLEYRDNNESNPFNYLLTPHFIKRQLYFRGMTVETYRIITKLCPQLEESMSVQVFEAVRAGNLDMANELVQRLVKHPNYGFNNLHADVLNPLTGIIEKFGKTSVTKKANTNKDITPLHCACINPNEKILK